MKTLLVRPLFIETLDIKTSIVMKGVMPNLCRLTTDVIDDEEWLRFGKPQQLILISLNPDEKIEIGDVFYSSKYNTIDTLASNGVIDKLTSYKVIATQDQLSPDLINQLVSEFNNDGMKDLEIEMHNNLNDPERLYDFEEPYMPNGFVTVVDTVIGKPLEDYIREKHSQDRCMGFIDGYEARKSEENLLYTNEEIFILGDKYDEYCINCFGNLPKSFSDWFNENKKK